MKLSAQKGINKHLIGQIVDIHHQRLVCEQQHRQCFQPHETRFFNNRLAISYQVS